MVISVDKFFLLNLGPGWVDSVDDVGELAGHIDIGGGHRPGGHGEPQGGEGRVVGVQWGKRDLVSRSGLLLGLCQTGGDSAAQDNLEIKQINIRCHGYTV